MYQMLLDHFYLGFFPWSDGAAFTGATVGSTGGSGEWTIARTVRTAKVILFNIKISTKQTLFDVNLV
jgi:hypothetical protein